MDDKVVGSSTPLPLTPQCGARNLFLLGHKWGTILLRGLDWWGAYAPRVRDEGLGSPSCKGGLGCHPGNIVENLLPKSCLLVPRAPKSWPLLV